MLDVALGQVDAVTRVMQELLGEDRAKVWLAEQERNKSRAARTACSTGEEQQFDSTLPPEIPTSWIQCEGCLKWRRVPWHIDAETLPDMWYCQDITWDADLATCSAEQDVWDPSRESTLETHGEIEKDQVFEILKTIK